MITDPTGVPANLAEFEVRVRASLNPDSLPSIAYGIARGNETLLLGASGLANRELGIAATPSTAYSLASVTKPMTTTALMLLAERGLIDLQAPVNRYLGDAKVESKVGDADEATVWRVADHSAGLPMHFRFYYADEPYSRKPMDEVIKRYAKLYTEPGARHYYSNLGYGLLDTIIENVTGRSYAECMADEVFAPLGMDHSSIGAPGTAYEAVAYGPDGVPYPYYDFDHPGGSAGYSSVEDLLAFGRFHLGFGPSLAPASSLTSMHRRTAPIGDHTGYGFGWGVNEDRLGIHVVQHSGLMGGVTTMLRLVPEMDLVIAVVTNGQSDLASRATDDALASLVPEFRERLLEDRMKPKPETAVTPVPDEVHGRWEGRVDTYAGPKPLTLEIKGGTEGVARLNGKEHILEELQIRDGRILTVFDGDLDVDDVSVRPYRVHLDLKQTGGVLSGAALTLTNIQGGGGGAPEKRYGNALAFWTELTIAR